MTHGRLIVACGPAYHGPCPAYHGPPYYGLRTVAHGLPTMAYGLHTVAHGLPTMAYGLRTVACVP